MGRTDEGEPHTTVSAGTLIRRARSLLLDFDGPLAALMPPPANVRAANHVRTALESLVLPAEILKTTDHLAVLRHCMAEHPEAVANAEEACTEAELEAGRVAEPGVHAEQLLGHARRYGLPTAVVSNNSPRVVKEFLDRHGWSGAVDVCVGREPDTVHGMKPRPDFLEAAREMLDLGDTPTVFVGDTVSDILACRTADIPVIGLARDIQRYADLRDTGADAVVRLGDHAALLG